MRNFIIWLMAVASWGIHGCATPLREKPKSNLAYRLALLPGDEDFKPRLDQIERELDSLAEHEWAGIYDCKSLRLVLAPQAGAIAFYVGSLGEYPLNQGDVVAATEEKITILWKGLCNEYFLSNELIRIRKDGREFLVPPSRLAEFREFSEQNAVGSRISWWFLTRTSS